jgi:hypothetical protein
MPAFEGEGRHFEETLAEPGAEQELPAWSWPEIREVTTEVFKQAAGSTTGEEVEEVSRNLSAQSKKIAPEGDDPTEWGQFDPEALIQNCATPCCWGCTGEIETRKMAESNSEMGDPH